MNLLEILSCIFVANLNKIGMLMFPWQHIFKSALVPNQPIHLSNEVTVTLFLNQSLENFEVSLDMMIGTSAQNFSKIQCFILPWQHILWRYFWQIGSSKSVMTSLWWHFLINLSKILYFSLLYQEASLCKIWAKSDKKQTSCKKWEIKSLWHHF